MEQETGIIREHWNYFKRGKNEINFLLNVYQTIIIIWAGSQIAGGFFVLVGLTFVLGIILIIVSVGIGKYSLTKVDPALAFINPFTQDIVVYRSFMAKGLLAQNEGNLGDAIYNFMKAEGILKRWLNE